MWKLICVLCVLPLLVSSTTARDRHLSASFGKDKRSAEFDIPNSILNQLGKLRHNNCAVEGFYGVPSNCSQFYRCVLASKSLIKFDFSCPPGTIWDDYSKACNFRAHVPRITCIDVDKPLFNIPQKVYLDPPSFVMKFHLTSQQLLYVCPSTIRRHPIYCNIMYQCHLDHLLAKYSIMYCPDSSFYDPEKIQCVNDMPPPSSCQMYQNYTMLDTIKGIKTFAPLCTEVGYVSVSSDPCEEDFVECKINKVYGFMEALYMHCNNGVFVPSKKQCVAKAQIAECN